MLYLVAAIFLVIGLAMIASARAIEVPEDPKDDRKMKRWQTGPTERLTASNARFRTMVVGVTSLLAAVLFFVGAIINE